YLYVVYMFACSVVLWARIVYCFLVFFFQAEDGIRDFHVTGVQTCALPILRFGHLGFAAFQKHYSDRHSVHKLRVTVFLVSVKPTSRPCRLVSCEHKTMSCMVFVVF